MDFTLTVKSQQGQVLTTPETIGANQKLAIGLASLITQLGGDPTGAFSQGSVSIYFVGTIMPLVGQITLTNPQQSLVYESVMVEHDPGRSDIPAVLNGLWWGLGGGRAATVMVSNTSASAQTAQVYLDIQGQRQALPTPLSFVAYETKVLDITQLLTTLGVSPAQAPTGGITIVQNSTTPTLIAAGRITDPTSGFSSTIDFPAPDLEIASALHATGVPIGVPSSDSPFAGAGTFTPHVVVRNLSATAQTVTVTFEYPQPPSGTGPAPAALDPVSAQDGTHSPATVQSPLAPITVPAYSTQDISLAAAMSQFPTALPLAAVRIQYSGAPGSLQAEVSSVESVGNLVIDSHIQNEGNGWASSGANPWHLDGDTESILFLTNESDQVAHMGFRVTANGSAPYFLTKLKLNPHETRAIDIRKLRDAQKPDFHKNLIPSGATDGSVAWIRGDNVAVMGRMMQIHRKAGMASNYDCCFCQCPYNYDPPLNYMHPTSCGVAVGSELSVEFEAGYTDCNYDYYYNYTDSASWTSSNPSVAEIVGYGLIKGVGAGTTTIQASYSGYTYSFQGSYCLQSSPLPGYANCASTATANVQITQVSVSPTSINTESGTTNATVTVDFSYQMVETEQTVDVQIGINSTSPSGGTATINPGVQAVTLYAGTGPGYASAQATLSAANCPVGSLSCVFTIGASLSNPSSGLTIVAPSPPTNASNTLTVNVK
jgi:hypothetical protein